MGVNWKQRTFRAGLDALYYSGAHKIAAPWAQGAGVIFMLHRVLAARNDAFQPNGHLEITPGFLEAVARRVRALDLDVIDLDEARTRLLSPEPQRRFAVFTFDDGYRDNFEVARPILARFDMPFTVYVASGMVDHTTELWWLALERIIARHERLEVETGDGELVFECASHQAKTRTFRRLADRLTEIPEDRQRDEVRRLASRYDFDLGELCAEVSMNWDDVRALAGDPLVSIGAHTHDHFAVARLSESRARDDITRGVERIAAETGQTPRHFAYPYGYPSAAGPRDFSIAAEMGFATAVTTRPGVVFEDHRDHMTALPRVSLNGHFQDLKYLDLFLTGAPFALYNRFQKVNAA